MIQNVISRMATNSFYLKGWTVTLVVGLFAFANVKDMNAGFILLSLIPAVVFWGLDGYFLHQERAYVKLYQHVINLNNDQINFSLRVGQYKSKKRLFSAIFSPTLFVLYAPIVIVIIASFFIACAAK